MQEKEILEVEQGTSSSENIDGVYTLSVTGEGLDAAIIQVGENKTNIEALQDSVGTLSSDVDGVEASISGINSSITTINEQINTLNLAAGNEGSLTKAVTTLQGAVSAMDTRLVAVEDSVSEENEFEERVSTLEEELDKIDKTVNGEDQNVYNGISYKTNRMYADYYGSEGSTGFQATTTDQLSSISEDIYGPVNPETNERENGIKDKLTSVRGTVYGVTDDQSDGLVPQVMKLNNTVLGTEEGEYKDGLITRVGNLEQDVDELPTEEYVDGEIERIEDSVAGLTTRVGNLEHNFSEVNNTIGTLSSQVNSDIEILSSQIKTLEDKTIFKFENRTFSIAANRESIINNGLFGIENIVGFELTYAYYSSEVYMLYIPYESINYFSTAQTLPGTTITLKIEPAWTMVDKGDNKHELYLIPVYTFNNSSSLPVQIAIKTFYSQTNDNIPGSYVQ